jgi:hypothetical protein
VDIVFSRGLFVRIDESFNDEILFDPLCSDRFGTFDWKSQGTIPHKTGQNTKGTNTTVRMRYFMKDVRKRKRKKKKKRVRERERKKEKERLHTYRETPNNTVWNSCSFSP